MKVWVVIPAYNEGEALGVLLQELKKRGLATIVVDDGSGDCTYGIAAQHAHHVIRHKRNLGKGRSLREAIAYLLEREVFDYLITMDADGQHAPSDLPLFLDEANRGTHFVLGNRMHNPFSMPRVRIITNKLMSWLISRLTRQVIPDSQCGFRLIKKEVLEKIQVHTDKFEIESEILFNASRAGFAIKSIPIQSIYFKHKKSNIRPFADAARFINLLFRLNHDRS
ncbi:MAG: glycosyltransferase family 2 protein [Candidatus Omnitrophota bacterium]